MTIGFKKVLSILLLALFVFNLGGYYLFFWALETHANLVLQARLNNEKYHPTEVIEIRIPLTLPYPLQQHAFERTKGSFVANNEVYQLVKQKHENDTLVIVCMKDKRAMQLNDMMTSLDNNAAQDQNKGVLNCFGKLLLEFENQLPVQLVKSSGWEMQTILNEHTNQLTDSFQVTPDHPPKS